MRSKRRSTPGKAGWACSCKKKGGIYIVTRQGRSIPRKVLYSKKGKILDSWTGQPGQDRICMVERDGAGRGWVRRGETRHSNAIPGNVERAKAEH